MTRAETPSPRLTIVMPVYDDWQSAARLIVELGPALDGLPFTVEIVAVDDCSTQPGPAQFDAGEPIDRLRVIRLAGNVGHQRAIAIGLMRVVEDDRSDLIAVMDADGEDRPVELRRLIDDARRTPGFVVVAKRQRRSESRGFRLFYWAYLWLFRLLTGHRIRFGNFSLLDRAQARRIANSPQVWNNFAASIVHSRLPIHYVPTARGTRYAGRSTMNFVSLVTHGLGAISVFSEAVFIRILITSSAIFGVSIAASVTALALRAFTTLAIPGWATAVLGFSLIISIQALITPVMIAFLMLASRSSVQPLPRSVVPMMIDGEYDIAISRPTAGGPRAANRGRTARRR